jgi:transcriptional regulator with XRE-family HTH domain
MDNSFFADKLKKARHFQHMTLDELAKRVGLSKSYLSLMEKGVKEPSQETIRALARALSQNEMEWAFTKEIPKLQKIRKEFPTLFYRFTKSQNSAYSKLKKAVSRQK